MYTFVKTSFIIVATFRPFQDRPMFTSQNEAEQIQETPRVYKHGAWLCPTRFLSAIVTVSMCFALLFILAGGHTFSFLHWCVNGLSL